MLNRIISVRQQYLKPFGCASKWTLTTHLKIKLPINYSLTNICVYVCMYICIYIYIYINKVIQVGEIYWEVKSTL